MKQLSKREQSILAFVKAHPHSGNADILGYLKENGFAVSRVTVTRDLKKLTNENFLAKHGKGRSVTYTESIATPLLSYVPIDEYCDTPPDERTEAHTSFRFDIFSYGHDLFTEKELNELHEMTGQYRQNKAALSDTLIAKEFERVIIEFSWKSSRIEGNTYTLLDTERLIKEQVEAEGHTHNEAVMILNHKKALEWILENSTRFRNIELPMIEELHRIIIADLPVSQGLRQGPVGITGSVYRPLDNRYQIREVLETAIDTINSANSTYEKALLSLALISYIQPFDDGNKRTSRLLANALLLAGDCCPLSFRSIDEEEYKKAMIVWYEQHSLRYLKRLFIDQYTFAVQNYFGASS